MGISSKYRGVIADIKEHRREYVLSVVASFGGMLFGWDTGLIGGVLTMPAFQNSFDLSPKSSSYKSLSGNIVSVLQAGCFFGAAASFFVSDKFGRRAALLSADGIFLLGSIMQTCSGIGTKSLGLLYAGRVVGGFGVGLISAVVPTYIGEMAECRVRGRCIGMMQLFNVTGIALSYFINFGMNQSSTYGKLDPARWRIPFALQMIPGSLLLIGMLMQEESPRWLVEKARIGEARHSLAHVRAKSEDNEDVKRELEDIVQDFDGREKLRLVQQLRAACSNKSDFYRFRMAIILMFWQQWTGTNSINYYSPQIFEAVGLSGTSAGLFATGIYGVVKIVCTALGLMFAIETLGRKYGLIASSIGQAFSMFYIGIHSALDPNPTLPLTSSTALALTCIYLFVVFYSFGWGPIPFIVSSECAPNHIRSLVMAAALMTQWLFNFVIAKITPLMLADIPWGTFIVFGVCSVVMGIYVVLAIPETKGVPLESVGLLFEGDIIKGATQDMLPRKRRSRKLQHHPMAEDDSMGISGDAGKVATSHVEEDAGSSTLEIAEEESITCFAYVAGAANVSSISNPSLCTRPGKTAISYRGDGEDLPSIYEALTTCHNITSLELELYSSGCVVGEYPWVFDFKAGDRFPALKRLEVDGYDFESRTKPLRPARKWIEDLFDGVQEFLGWETTTYDVYGLKSYEEPSLEEWRKAMDFTRIEELRLSSIGILFYERMKHELPSLHTLTLESAQLPSEILDFIQNVPPLESLSIHLYAPYPYDEDRNRTQFPLSDIIERHGSELRSLQLHQGESDVPGLRRPMLSTTQIAEMRASCPNLVDLGLDIDRNGTWPVEIFDAIVSIPTLQSLSLILEIGADLHEHDGGLYSYNPEGLDGEGPFREPRMSLSASEALFADLRKRKVGAELQYLNVTVGDYMEIPYSGPLYFPNWEEGRARKFVCAIRSEDGETLRCKKLGGS